MYFRVVVFRGETFCVLSIVSTTTTFRRKAPFLKVLDTTVPNFRNRRKSATFLLSLQEILSATDGLLAVSSSSRSSSSNSGSNNYFKLHL
jgi:hypothetical protein